MIETINPSSMQAIAQYPTFSRDKILTVLERSHQAFTHWHPLAFKQRAKKMRNLAMLLLQQKQTLATQMANEMGKPISQGAAEIEKCAWVCEYYAEHTETFLQPRHVSTEAQESMVTFQPLGSVLAIMPWNFPHWQVFRFAAPTIMAGNVGVLKHASNVMGSAIAIEQLFLDAGFPEGVFSNLVIGSDEVEFVIQQPTIQAVTLTGSTNAGKAVAATAGQMLKKTVLELGGSDPYLILADADIELAAEACVQSRLINSGQSCIAAKRFIVHHSVHDQFTQLFTQKMQSKTMGDPLSEDTDIGPQAKESLRDELHQQVTASTQQGAVCILGGEIPSGAGAYYPPTVLTNVTPGMPAFDQELFGPVAAIIRAESEQHAIELANHSIYGLGSAVFSQNVSHAKQIAATQLHAGSCFVNSFVKSDPRLPFGGIKQSGYGRELGEFGLLEFTNIKTVSIA